MYIYIYIYIHILPLCYISFVVCLFIFPRGAASTETVRPTRPDQGTHRCTLFLNEFNNNTNNW